ncbi:hypothetical protein XELAEV_18000434mg, partial [Xenopus laevis]
RSLKDKLCPSDNLVGKKQSLFLSNPKKGTFPCLNRICCTSIIKGNTVGHPTKGTAIKLNDYVTCESNDVIYMLKCPCGQVYIGETTRAVTEPIKEHRGNIRNFIPVSRRFSNSCHNLKQLKWCVVEKVHQPGRGGNTKTILSQREAYGITQMNTMSPIGMNDSWSINSFM